MEEDGANVVEMAIQGEQAPSGLIGPYLDLVIITARNKERLRFVKINAADRPIVLFEPIDQSSHPIIP